MIYTIILCTIFGVFIISSLIIGFWLGQKNKLKEKLEIKSPIKAIKENKEIKKQELKKAYEDEIEEINLYNIEAYDGTPLGQKSFPER